MHIPFCIYIISIKYLQLHASNNIFQSVSKEQNVIGEYILIHDMQRTKRFDVS